MSRLAFNIDLTYDYMKELLKDTSLFDGIIFIDTPNEYDYYWLKFENFYTTVDGEISIYTEPKNLYVVTYVIHISYFESIEQSDDYTLLKLKKK